MNSSRRRTDSLHGSRTHLYSSLLREGFVLLHDSVNPLTEVPRTMETLAARGLPMVTVDREVGLSLVQIARRPEPDYRWPYLLKPSDRAGKLLPYVNSILRDGDVVLDMYCGYSPLAPLLEHVEIVGWDRHAAIIERLRRDAPGHQWLEIEERSMPFSDQLPERADVIIGLGLSHGYTDWDPYHVLNNVLYLLGRYFPRACLFETAVDYHEGGILRDIAEASRKLGYSCRFDAVDTDMQAFPRRQVLVTRR